MIVIDAFCVLALTCDGASITVFNFLSGSVMMLEIVNQCGTDGSLTFMHIENYCSNSPFGLIWQVRRSLRWISRADLVGISQIRLVDHVPVSHLNGEEIGRIHGFYHFQKAQDPPYILLSVKEIYKGIPSVLWWTTIPTLRISCTLAHEVAHHVAATRGYVFEPGDVENNEESIADKYAEFVVQGMMKKWYYRLAQWCIKELAEWYFVAGISASRRNEYESAAEYFFNAYDLNPEHMHAGGYYRQAKEQCNATTATSKR